MGHKTNLIKYIGNIITIFAVFLIFKKLFSYDLNYELFHQPHIGICIIICLVAYVMNVLASPLPWMQILEITSDYKVPYNIAISVSVRSNLLKYIPGNIFQYLGKNELAVKCEISHSKVAISTMIDVVIMFFTSLLLGILLVRKYFYSIIKHYITQKFLITAIIVILLIIILFFLYITKSKFIQFGTILKFLIKKKNIKYILKCIIYYVIQNLWVGLIYVLVLSAIFNQTTEDIPVFLIIGANIISWAVGFITPGAPGGLGIREAVMIFITHGKFDESIITLSSVLYRLITIIGDLTAFLIVFLYYKRKQQSVKNIRGEENE